MRYLGIDYGEKRIGLAVSDGEGKIAFPYATVETVDDVCAAAKKEGVSRIVVGLPLPFKARDNRQVGRVKAFAADLKKKLQLPEAGPAAGETAIDFENEIFTTKIAGRHSPAVRVDASAAALILQSYLDKQNAKSTREASC